MKVLEVKSNIITNMKRDFLPIQLKMLKILDSAINFDSADDAQYSIFHLISFHVSLVIQMPVPPSTNAPHSRVAKANFCVSFNRECFHKGRG